MRKLWIALLAVSFAASGFAQVGVWMPQSFRLQGTSLIEDDFDNAIDPIDIGLVEGNRLYTNLSNLLNYKEQMLANVSQDQYLLGYSGSLLPMMPALKTLILIESKKKDDAFNVTLPDVIDPITGKPVSGFGEVSGDYKDWTGDDYKYWKESQKNETTISDKVFLFNNLYDMETMKLGARIRYLSGNKTRTTDYYGWTPTFEEYYKEYEDSKGKTIDTTAEKGEFSTKEGYSDLGFLFSGAMAMAGMELRANLNFTMHSENTKPDDDYTEYHNHYPYTDSFINNGNITQTVTGEDKRSDMGLGLSGRARKYIEGGYLEAGAGFGISFGGDIERNIKWEYDEESTTRFFYATADSMTEDTWDNYYDDIADGDYSNTSLGAGAKAVLPFGEELLFGIGVNLGYNKYKETVDDKPVNYSKYITNDNDHAEDDYDDYTYTSTTTGEEKKEKEITTTSWNFPVGFEYKLGKKKDFRFRLGAIATFIDRTTKVTRTNTKPTETITLTDYTDIDLTDVGDTTKTDCYGSIVEETPTFDQTTVYTYGLGWYPTENLQIDLLGFLDPAGDIWTPAFYRNLRLSVTLKFF